MHDRYQTSVFLLVRIDVRCLLCRRPRYPNGVAAHPVRTVLLSDQSDCAPAYIARENLCHTLDLGDDSFSLTSVCWCPANAYATDASYGPVLECNWGFRAVDETCVAAKVPPNAYLNASGIARWTCDRGYRPVDETCVAIEVPVNGYLTGDSYGTGWKCDRGCRAATKACVALEIPENAHIDYSGNDWECNEPYRKR
jgi:hypothetical protein